MSSDMIEPKPSLRRIILPIVLVLGTFFCGYGALFWGVKEDLPAPANAIRFPLSLTNQAVVKTQWSEDTKNYKTTDIAVYVLRDTSDEAIAYWRNNFVTRRNWKEIEPPGQPALKDVPFSMIGFNRVSSKIIIAITSADKLLEVDNELTRAIKSSNYRKCYKVAIMIACDLN